MTFLKLTKNKTRLFLSLIIATFVVGVLSLLVNRFLILNYYHGVQIFYHQLINFFIDIIKKNLDVVLIMILGIKSCELNYLD